MKLFPDIELPRFFCDYINYTQTFEIVWILFYALAIYGLMDIIFRLYKYFSTMRDP